MSLLKEASLSPTDMHDVATAIEDCARQIHMSADGLARIGSRQDIATVLGATLIEEIGMSRVDALKVGLIQANRLTNYMGGATAEAVAS